MSQRAQVLLLRKRFKICWSMVSFKTLNWEEISLLSILMYKVWLSSMSLTNSRNSLITSLSTLFMSSLWIYSPTGYCSFSKSKDAFNRKGSFIPTFFFFLVDNSFRFGLLTIVDSRFTKWFDSKSWKDTIFSNTSSRWLTLKQTTSDWITLNISSWQCSDSIITLIIKALSMLSFSYRKRTMGGNFLKIWWWVSSLRYLASIFWSISQLRSH